MFVTESNGYSNNGEERETGQAYREMEGYKADGDADAAPSADEFLEAVCSRADGLILNVELGAEDGTEPEFTSIGNPEVDVETTPDILFLYLDRNSADLLAPYLSKYRSLLNAYLMDGNKSPEEAPYIALSFYPERYGGNLFLGCSMPDGWFPVADSLGAAADRLCLVFQGDSVGVFTVSDDAAEGGPEEVAPGYE